MPPRARDKEFSRRSWLLAGVALPLFRARGATELSVLFDGDNLKPVAPNLHFLNGRSLDRLRDADTVMFVSRLSLFTIDQSVPFRQAPGRFIVSYDIWEERFKVTIPGASPRSKVGATATQAEAWCLDNLAISAAGLAPDRPFFLRLELRTADPREISSVITDPGISLRAFIELFSRKAGPDDPHWGPFESNRVRLSDLGHGPGRGMRNG